MDTELKRRVYDSIKDEKHDIDKYKEMIKMAKEEHCDELCAYLKAIEHDEETHADLLEKWYEKY